MDPGLLPSRSLGVRSAVGGAAPPSTPRPSRPGLLAVLLGLLGLFAGTSRAEEAPRSRWYESRREGKKTGWTQVTWSASTWQGKTTVHDHTESLTRTAWM